ncbi:MAG: tripartite tricarboxylate transporter substrate binding protein BugD [Betaproteobacteria bacterium]|nr:tripartite tricarboxylate transporter substrate binding protein BugD [Betaproteobacteria bacterium]
MRYKNCLLLIAALALSDAFAQTYPNKTITLIVPAAAGGPTDTVSRMIAQSMGRELKGQIVVENAGGAGGTIGAGRVARAAGDGYTLYVYHIGQATFPALYRKLAFDALNDFEPIGRITNVPMTLVAKRELAANDFKELMAWIKANGSKVSLATAGLGSVSNLCALLLRQSFGTDPTLVPYKGTGPAMNDLLGGQVDVMCDQTTNTTPHIKGGRIKAFGVTTLTRVGALKDLPTLDELGLKGFDLSAWHALWAAKGTPKPIVDELVKALQAALKDLAVIQRFADLGTEPVREAEATPAALYAHLKAEIDRWGPIIRAAGQFAD